MRKYLVLVLAMAGLMAACGPTTPSSSQVKEAWAPSSDPRLLHAQTNGYQWQLARLPLDGAIPVQPWADDYWPSYTGGIAKRWEYTDAWTYESPSLLQLQLMSQEEMKKLSPAEKLDIFVGAYHYPTVARERLRVRPTAPTWEGLCHGWAPAALVFEEPRATVVTNADGIAIPFGSSDVKALLTYAMDKHMQTEGSTSSVGLRCNNNLSAEPAAARSLACRDVNAGAFHVALTNEIGLRKKGFVADVTRDAEVWNHPIYAYRSRILGHSRPHRGAAFGTVREVMVETDIDYTVEISPTWEPVVGTEAQAISTRTYQYRLELDYWGQVIGGEWLTDDRPDFLWTETKPEVNDFNMGILAIYRQAR